MKQTTLKVGFAESVTVLAGMIIILGTGVIGFGLSPLVPVLTTIALIILWAKVRGFSWEDIHEGISKGVSNGIIPLVIFLLIGAIISTWIAAGIIPSMMVLGFHMISAQWFVPSVFLVCALIGSSIGSAFTIISTVGIALFGMGLTMGVQPALVAGAVISGAIFGDKMSPLSASTNLASAIAEDDLFDHIRNMMWSTIPAFVLSLILYGILGQGSQHLALGRVETTLSVLNSHFVISWWAALPIVVMMLCAIFKIPAIATLFLNIGIAIGMTFIQTPGMTIKKMAAIIESGYVAHTGNSSVDTLLTRGGINAMLGTIALILLTLSLGGLLMQFGLIQTAMTPLINHLHSDGSMVTAAILSGIGVNVFVGEQYLSVLLPGKAFKRAFNQHGLNNLALSRVLEDGGTVINYLVPWGVAGAFAANTLGVSTLAYLPFCFFSILSPIFSILSGYTGIGLKHTATEPVKAETVID
ncbi:Na+/H+ antiporter NhaC [Levilactobacillus bambusae]|uniref:Na+/H+ antiporter NhaC n=1 Tax=Levilactobacillus bambusae TaxID=2024736 RepID=A0A2V1MXT2_9LACO|nr:Na+/H+ antiporter NhaC [Levilactobacillus bambusae]PWF99806.1 Na+/H+ antiporter NhaC [Levilactobacillus bambusae]